MNKSKIVKKLTMILFTLVAIFGVGLTNVNAETTTTLVEDRDALVNAMNDKTTDIVRLNKNIELSSEYNTTFSIEKSKTLDLNGHTITVPEGKEINFWYYADADIKIMNSSNSSSAKIIGNHTGSSTYFLLRGAIIRDAEKVNFEIDGVDFEVKNSNFTTIVFMKNGQKYENLIIKNSNVNGNQYLFWSGAAKKVYLESITLNRAEGAERNLYRQLSNTSSLTVNDVIDANAVIEYYPSRGVKATADRTAKLNTSDLNAYWGPITVKFADGTPVIYTITFNSNGGTSVASQNIKAGEKLTKPTPAPTKDGFTFDGWYEDSTFSKEFDFNTPITSDMNLYAKWKAANSINEIRLVGDVQYGNVPAGILPSFNPGTTTDSITINKMNSSWEYKMESGGWSGFGLETPVAYNDGKTNYGYDFCVKTNDGYQLDYSNLKVFYNDVEVTPSVRVLKYAWGAYVTVDLGKAIGENPTTHTVTFNSNGGSEIAPKEVVSGLKIKAPDTPTKDKYLFRGWYEDDTFSIPFDFNNTPITSDMTLYAKWEAANSINEIRLAGDIQYGNVLVGTLPSFNPRTTTDSITIDKTNSYWSYKMQNGLWSGFGLETPTAVNDGKTEYGYTFNVKPSDGYQLASDLKVIYNDEDVTSTVKVTKYSWGAYVDVNLGKANGTPVVYTVTFNSNDGTSVASQNVNAGEKLEEPTPAPTKEGFTFDGWYEDLTSSKKFDFNTPITDSMTLYAKWIENKYTVTFDANGGSGEMTPATDLTGEYTLPENEFTAPDGKKFKGWSLTKDGEIVTKVTMDKDVKVYAIWEAIPVTTYTVTFDANGGGGEMTPATDLTGEYTLPENGFTAPDGKKFKGWSLTTDGEIVTKVTMDKDIKVYAIWEAIPVTTYTLTFDANGGTGSMTAKTGLTGEYTLPSNGFTAPSGKKFKGWSLTTDGAIVTKVDMTENKTVYAIWENIIYTVTFNSNGGTSVASQNVNAGEKLTEPTPAPTKAGFTFDGWYEDATLNTKFDFNTSVVSNLNLYAKWTENKYTLTFEANGGTGSMTAKTGLTGEYTLPENGFTAPDGKKFKGWSLTTDGAIVTKVDMTENKTVYAIWEAIPVTTYTVTFDANGGSGEMTAKTGLTGEYTLPENGFTAPSGKQFKGWSLTTDGAIVTKVDMTENRTVYAIWEDIIYSYEFLESTGEQTIDGKTNSFKIVIDADETKFVSLEIDEVLYEKDVDYTVKHGSTIIEFTSTGLAKLNALSKGEHTVRVTFTDEVINGKITVNAVNPPIIPQNPDIDNPQTSDGIFTYITMFVVSILGLITLVIIGKKRTRTN